MIDRASPINSSGISRKKWMISLKKNGDIKIVSPKIQKVCLLFAPTYGATNNNINI